MLKIYNTLSKQKEEFVPINPSEVKMYVCGPTVYDLFHVGNARSFILADIVRRYLSYKGYKVKFVMNLTDVDDKIIKKSNEENIDTSAITSRYIKAFFNDIAELKIQPADVYPKATEHMQDIIEMIEKLEDEGFAYNVNGNVFYDVGKFPGYGKLSGKKIDELESGARVEVNEQKKNPLDFSLWKKAKGGEPSWQSRWGNGRPGWHIECSAMSCKHLGEYFDIHAGGNDLIFPHHENEIAQSVAANKKPFVKYWLHFGFLNINQEKMSKSLGNFFTARDVLKKYSAEAIRLFFSQAYYRGPLDFTYELLMSAAKGLEKFSNLLEILESEFKKNKNTGNIPVFDFEEYKQKFTDAMDDDFNTAQAVAVIFDFVRDVNRTIAENENIDSQFFKAVKNFLAETAEGVLGIISFNSAAKSLLGLEDDLINLLIDLRLKAKLEKNYKLSDEIRERLKELGIILKDTKEGTTFRKV